MYLQRNKSLPISNLLITYLHRLRPIQPRSYLISFGAYSKLVPFCRLQQIFTLCRRFYQPSPAIRFINAAGVVTFRSNFDLPSADLRAFNSRADEYSTVAIRLELEFEFEYEVVVVFVGGKVTVLLIRTTL